VPSYLPSHKEFILISSQLSEVVVHPIKWEFFLEKISGAIGATGAALLQSDVRTNNIPRTKSVDDLFNQYFEDGWHMRDIRTRSIPMLLRGRVAGDDDITSPDEMRSHPYYAELLRAHGFGWFAGIGFHSGPAHWAVSIQRSAREGMFEADQKVWLARLAPRLTEVATLAHAIGRAALDGMKTALDAVGQPAILLHKSGRVLDWNAAADRVLGEDLKIVNGHLRLSDPQAGEKLAAMLHTLRLTRDGLALATPSFTVSRKDKMPVVVRVVAIDGPAQSFLVGGSAMLLLHDLTPDRLTRSVDQIREAFQLSLAEARLVAHLAAGDTVAAAANRLGIARETARNQLKAALAKTGTHRQADLVAHILRIPENSA
jgi:DNA-binding CsgD family transcriptional regulator/PAS domain-containing protein